MREAKARDFENLLDRLCFCDCGMGADCHDRGPGHRQCRLIDVYYLIAGVGVARDAARSLAPL